MRIWSHDRVTSRLGMRGCFNDEDSPVIGDRVTDFGSWIDFNFFATSKSRANQIALIL